MTTSILLFLATLAATSPRQEIPLDGRWEHIVVDELTTPPTGAKWQPITVPGYLHGIDYKRAWLRRSFDVPELSDGMRLGLRFGGVKYNCRVFVNGRPVGGCFGGYEPFEIDVTDAVRRGSRNELAVGVHDWTGVFTPGRVSLPTSGDANKVRGMPQDKILAPIGGMFNLYGIWDSVTLVAHPAVYIKSVFIKPSVRQGELVIDYALANQSRADAEVNLSAAVEDAGRDVLRLPPMRAHIPAGKTLAVTLRQAWKTPHLWSHVDPYLYRLRSELAGGDVLRTRFGFREFWTQGSDFYLNGAKTTLLATSWWPPHKPVSREHIVKDWQAVKNAGCIAFRTHTQPWPEIYYDVADELGLLVMPEGPVWNDREVYRINDSLFWQNYGRALEGMVERLRNHPSIVMWSLENEFHGGRLNDNSPAKADLVRMGRLVKHCDPTRPIYYESDGDPGGVADVIGMHYPHEYPDFTCWPNEAYWLERPMKPRVGMFLNGQPVFRWPQPKPLYIGEFLWVPSTDPSWNTVFFGDRAYIDYHRYQNLAKAEAWKMQILGYRHEGVRGISPWTMIEGGPLDAANPLYQAHCYAYQHVAAYCHNYDRRFYAGTEVRRRVEVFNDILEPSPLSLTWTLDVDGRAVDRGSRALRLGPGEKQVLNVTLKMPAVSRVTPAQWHVKLARHGRLVFEDHHAYSVWPRHRLSSEGATIGLYDPRGEAKKLFAEQRLTVIHVPALKDIDPRIEVLVIGPKAFGATPTLPALGEVSPQQAGLDGLLARGGRLLVLEQEAWPTGLLGLQLTKQESTMTFPFRPGHPALAGVAEDDLRFWRGDHMVSAAEPNRPTAGSGRAIVVSGSAAGIAHAPLVELPSGKGLAVVAQLKLVEKFRSEPAAGQILGNLLAYLAHRRPVTPRKTLLVGGSASYEACLRNIGLRCDKAANVGHTDLARYGVIVCHGHLAKDAADAAQFGHRLRGFVEAGGRVWIHRPEGEQAAALLKAIGLSLMLNGKPTALRRAEGSEPILAQFAREDLYWLEERSEDWNGSPTRQVAAMCDGLLGHGTNETAARPHVVALTEPLAAVAVPLGKGMIVVDRVRWDGESVNFRRAARYAHSVAELLDADLLSPMAVTLKCDEMTPQKDISQFSRQGGLAQLACNGYITTPLRVKTAGRFTLEVFAGGTPAKGEYPIVEVRIDGRLVGRIHTAGFHCRPYPVTVELSAGRHELWLAFVNDLCEGGEDRNLSLEKVVCYKE